MNETTPRARETPEIDQVYQFIETIQDFTNPKEALREAISNALDWGASRVEITARMDKTKAPPELVVEIADDGQGLTEDRLKAFFGLGCSTARAYDEFGNKLGGAIGEKGHGTKTYFNSHQIEVESTSAECSVYAVMDDPLGVLRRERRLPFFEHITEPPSGCETGTRVVLRGYNYNEMRDFAHDILKDYILWFTKFGSIELEFGTTDHKHKVLLLQGLDRDEPEEIRFGHLFPRENTNTKKLRQEHPADWIDYYVKRWKFQNEPVIDYPGVKIDFVFYLEGDEAKRQYNHMIRGRGKGAEPHQYKVEDRYGIYACKDFMPVARVNEWLKLRKRMETKFHAFVNCQDFRMTANRGGVGNTPPDLLFNIQETVYRIFADRIMGSPEYYEYERYTTEYKGEMTAEKERKDFDRRRNEVLKKQVARFENIQLLEPRLEAGVFGLFVTLKSLYPDLFPFKIIDYDTSIGYDALISSKSVDDLTKDSMSFVEFKYALERHFDHSFSHLRCVVCWECGLNDGEEVADVAGRVRRLEISDPAEGHDYRKYMLTSKTEAHNIEVYVLKDYLKDKKGIEFKPRALPL
jgi:hypothetical protein